MPLDVDGNPYRAPEPQPKLLETIRNRRATKRAQELRAFFSVLGALTLPFVVMSLYLLLAETLQLVDFVTYLIAFAVGVVSGTTCLAKTPMPNGWREAACVLYVPVVAYLLFYFTFLFVGIVYGRWL